MLLANIAPALQHHVLDQMRRPRFVVADTMDLWLNVALPDLLKLLKRLDGFVLNDSEAHQLTRRTTCSPRLKKIHQLGPKYVVIKQGSHGSILSGPRGLFICPAYPLRKVVDPTGAGDSFVGGMMGYLAAAKGPIDRQHPPGDDLRQCGGVVLLRGLRLAAHDAESPAPQIDQRVKELEQLTRF